MENDNQPQRNTKEILEKLTIGLFIATLFIIGFNVVSINNLGKSQITTNAAITTTLAKTTTTSSLPFINVAPKGVPSFYGKELGVSYDDVSATDPQKAESTIKKLGVLDEKLSLQGADLARYIRIASRIGCEYCCGSPSIIFENGQAACGCSHSYAMRGVAKYLITYHPAEFTDDQILEELGKWKTLFFPDKLAQKAAILKAQGIELNYINLASNKYTGIEKKTSAGTNTMVGGC
ncbi:hypothetical protein HZB00_02760 [Candidatus Woesearchaeota archaeon]|nr:hypothetical protein [Candidatus Woesearchaeota archaeon]